MTKNPQRIMQNLEEEFRSSLIKSVPKQKLQPLISEMTKTAKTLESQNKPLQECPRNVACKYPFAFDNGTLCQCEPKETKIDLSTIKNDNNSKKKEFPYIEAEGTPFERGKIIGEQLKDQIIAFDKSRQDDFKGHIDDWNKYTKYAIPIMKKYTPIAFEEMKGMASVKGLNEDIIFRLAVESDFGSSISEYSSNEFINKNSKKSKSKNDHCTGFAIRPSDPKKHTLSGQTDDEYIKWYGKTPTIIKYKGKDENVVVYTHSGLPAYFGINEDGLSLLWETLWYDHTFNLKTGVPTVPMIRELLSKKDIEDAVQLFQSVPHPAPNNFTLSQKGKGIYNIETTPVKTIVTHKPFGTLVHSNHIMFNDSIAKKDYSRNIKKTTSQDRYTELSRRIHDNSSKKEIEDAFLNKPIINHHTIAGVIMDSEKGTMDVFYPYKKRYKSK